MSSETLSTDEYHAELARTMPERGRDGLQERVRKLALELGWKFYHPFWSQRSDSGFPDCLFLRGDRIVVAELKRENKEPTPAQQAWLDAFREAGIPAYLWKPSNLLCGEIHEVLR